jgi:peptidoglycan hydrolase CwlO-like protein
VLSIVIQNKTVKSKFKTFFSLQIRRNSQIMIKQQLEMRRKSIAEDCNFNEIDNHQENNENTTANHGTLDEQIENLKQLLKSRDAEINKLKREIHKLKVFTNGLPNI